MFVKFDVCAIEMKYINGYAAFLTRYLKRRSNFDIESSRNSITTTANVAYAGPRIIN